MPEFYSTIEEYQYGCPYWGHISLEMDARYKPNPWAFKSGYRPDPNKNEFVVVFRNFDNTEQLVISCVPTPDGLQIDYRQKPIGS